MVIYELHIWGPAFGLPSIDAECIAATAFLRRLLAPTEWVLVCGHDPSASPTGDFPALKDSTTWVGGFRAIVAHLRAQNHDLDNGLSNSQRADCTAIYAHLAAYALPLVDSTLFTSSTNYIHTTRPAYTKILPRHANFTVPPERYAGAINRTAPLGVSSGQVDSLGTADAGDEQRESQEARLANASPSLLFKRKQTLNAALKQQQSAMRFRLESLVDTLLEPLQARLAEQKYLGGEEELGMTSVDCCAFGYLSILANPDLPNAWVAELMRERYELVAHYVETVRAELFRKDEFSPETTMRAPLLGSTPVNNSAQLPWRIAPASSFLRVVLNFFTEATSSFFTPQVQHLLFERPLDLQNEISRRIPRIAAILSGGVGALATIIYLIYTTTHANPEPNKTFTRPLQGLARLGAAGAALSVLRY